MTRKRVRWLLCLALAAWSGRVAAQESSRGWGEESSSKDSPGYEFTTDTDEQPSTPIGEEIQRLQQLRRDNPEEFRRIIKEKKEQLRRRMARLKETDAEAYQAMVSRLRQRREQQLERLKARDPEQYRQQVERRREHLEQRLSQLRQSDPQRYEQLVQQRRQWRRQSLERLKERDPERYEGFIRGHPEWTQERGRAGPGEAMPSRPFGNRGETGERARRPGSRR